MSEHTEPALASLSPEDFSRVALQLYDDASALAGDSLESLMAHAKLDGLNWIEGLELVIVTCLLRREDIRLSDARLFT